MPLLKINEFPGDVLSIDGQINLLIDSRRGFGALSTSRRRSAYPRWIVKGDRKYRVDSKKEENELLKALTPPPPPKKRNVTKVLAVPTPRVGGYTYLD